ncbi:MAG: sterol desaturase family protein [Rhizobiales bacterium]|nr:sterol desaturase family protein [Hyphomicrobiales bacterium]
MTLEESRLYIFIATIALLALFEFIIPIFSDYKHRLWRWTTNFSLSFISVAILRFSFPFLAAGFATLMETHNIGLFNWLGLQGVTVIIISVLLLDVGIYGQHVLSHKIPILWRLHRLHHSDTQMDLSTAVRFHPIEIIFSMLFKFVLIAILGTPAIAVVIFELILSSGALFNHSNIRFSKKVDKWLQKIIVTPNMHRIHHSDNPVETDSNYGFSITLWDKIFNSYTENFDADYKVNTGLKVSDKQETHKIIWALKFPFSKN